MPKAIDVYLERRKTRAYAGRLSRIGKRFVFEYSEKYRLSLNPLAFGPDLPLHKKQFSSPRLFPSFADRIPMRQNPAYGDYCREAGISPAETDPMILLAALGRRAPSSFILEPVWEKPLFSGGDLKRFRARLKLSIREFADVFEISPSAVHRIESGKTSGRRALRQIEPYAKSPKAALQKMRQTGFKINEAKRLAAESALRSKLQAAAALGPWTVRAEDLAKCSPEQFAELLRRLILAECAHWGIPQSGAHVSGNINAPDGGQDGLIKWTEGPPRTDYFPRRYNCFQMKAKPVRPSECEKEILSLKGELKPAIKEVIKNKGAYILLSIHGVSGIQINEREEILKRAVARCLRKPAPARISEETFAPGSAASVKAPIEVQFYDGNRLASWASCYPSVAAWLLKEVCGRPLGPWLSWTEWSREDEDFSSQFMCHKGLEAKRNQLYEALSRPRQTARLIGASGLGKTRLALEALRPAAKDDLSPLILCASAADLKESDIRELKASRAIVIADDCPLEKAEAFHKIALQEDSRLSLLTIEHESRALESELLQAGETLKIKLEPDNEITKKILCGNQAIANKYFTPAVLEIMRGFPLMAKLLRDAGPRALLENDISTIKNKMLFGLREPDQQALKAIKACALFESVCFERDELERKGWLIASSGMPRRPEEARFIAKTICKMDYDEFYRHIQFFKKRKIIQQTGRFIQVRPKPLAVWLAKDLLWETPLESALQWLSDMKPPAEPEKTPGEESALAQRLIGDISKEEKAVLDQYQKDFLILHGLRDSFCRQLGWLKPSSAKAGKLAERMCGAGGLFGTEDALNTEWGSRCFLELAALCPKTALETLHQIYSRKPAAELLKKKARPGAPSFSYMRGISLFGSRGLLPYEGAMNLIAALRKLAAKKDFYPKAARLLLKFAEGEGPNNSCDSATAVFADHFQLLLSGTEAGPLEKFQIIGEIKKSGSLKQKEIAITALEKALKDRHFSRSGFMNEHKLGENVKDWQPQTKKEVLEYHRQALELLAQFALENPAAPEIQEMAQKAIVNHLPGMFWEGLYGEWEKSVKAIAKARGGGWPLAVESLLDFLDINENRLKAGEKNQLKALVDFLRPKGGLAGRLRFYISQCPWIYLYGGKNQPEREYEDLFGRLIGDFAGYLKRAEALAAPGSPLYVLFHGEQRNTARFARELAGKLPALSQNPLRFGLNLLEILKQWKADRDFNPSFLCGLIEGLEGLGEKSAKPSAPGKNPAAAGPARYKSLILDKIAGDSDLRSLLPAAYFLISLNDEDINRLTAALDRADWPADDLGEALACGSKCRSASPEAMSRLLRKLSEKSAACARAGGLAAEAYMHGQTPEAKKKLLPALFGLLTREGLYSERPAAPSGYSRWQMAFKNIIDNGEILESNEHGEKFARHFFSQIFYSKDSPYDLPIGHETIRACLKKILEKQPAAALSETAKILSGTGENSGKRPPEEKAAARQKLSFFFRNENSNWIGGLLNSLFEQGPLASQAAPEHHLLSAVPEEMLRGFCAKAPDHIPAFLAQSLCLFSYDKSMGRMSWSGFARFLFEEYGGRENLTEALYAGLGHFSWVRRGSDYFPQIRAAVEELKSHKHKAIRDFAENYLEWLEIRASRLVSGPAFSGGA